MVEYLQIGLISNTHGVKGEIKVVPLTDDPYRFDELKSAFIDKAGKIEKCIIEEVKHLQKFVVLKLKGVDTFEQAVALKNFYMLIDRKNAVKLKKDSYFICDILGSLVYDDDNKLLGKLSYIYNTGSNDIYVIKDAEGKELLLPALKSVIKEINVETLTIKVSIPEGLL